MSLRMDVYYSAALCAWAALLAWVFGRLIAPGDPLARAALQHMLVGGAIGAALNWVDAWMFTFRWFGAEIAIRVLVGGLVGCIAGLLGGLLGYGLASATESESVALIGWIMMGLLIGGTPGLFDLVGRTARGDGATGALKRFLSTLLGGGLGALAGGGLAVSLAGALARALTSGVEYPLFPGALTAVLLGSGIGLGPALVQFAQKEAWIRMEGGDALGRELILSRPQTMIGQAEDCDICVDDDAADDHHAQIVQWGSAYLLADAQSRTGAFVNERRIAEPTLLRSGDRIRVGNTWLLFRERRRGELGQ